MASRLLRLNGGLRSVAQRFKSTHVNDYRAALSSIPQTEVSILDNGVRVASENSGTSTATVGVWIDAGSRYEEPQTNGVGNYLENLIFKGTNKRAQADLELEVESLGASLNACTGREQTAYFAKCLSKDVPKLVEILSDVIQNSKLSESQVERERSRILRDVEETENDLKQVVLDHLHSAAFQGTPLGQTVLGPTRNIKSIGRADLQNYIDSHFKGARVVLAAAGGIDHKELVDAAKNTLGKLPNSYDGDAPELTPCRYTGSEIRVRDDSIPLAHVAIAVEGCGVESPDCVPLAIAKALVGSWDRSQGGGKNNAFDLASESAEEELCHSYESFSTCYKDTGLWGTYFVCDPLKCDDMIANVLYQWKRLCTIVTEADVERAKAVLKTNLLVELDGTTPNCDAIGRQLLSHGQRIPIDELESRIDSVSVQNIRDVCTKYIYDRCPTVSAVGPIENLTDYLRIRSTMYWVRL